MHSPEAPRNSDGRAQIAPTTAESRATRTPGDVRRLDARAATSNTGASLRLFVPVLVYHHVKWDRPGDDAIELGLTISPAQFQTEVTYLRQLHYHSVTAAQLAAALHDGTRLPAQPVVLTFDDGYSDVYTNVFGLLRREHLRATFFIVPGFVGRPRYLSWGQVGDMARHGMDIESHTISHPDLTVVPARQQWAEIHGSRQMLEQRLHRSVRVFAYPYGAYNAVVLRNVAAAGYLAAFTTHQGWWLSRGSVLQLPRVYVDRDDSLSVFAGRLRADPAILAQDPT